MRSGFDVDKNVLSAKLDEIKVEKALVIEEFEDLFGSLEFEVDDVFVKDLGLVGDVKNFMRVARKLLLLQNREKLLIEKFIERYASDLDFFDDEVDFEGSYGDLVEAYRFVKSRGDVVGVDFFRKKLLDAVRVNGDDLISFRSWFKGVSGDDL